MLVLVFVVLAHVGACRSGGWIVGRKVLSTRTPARPRSPGHGRHADSHLQTALLFPVEVWLVCCLDNMLSLGRMILALARSWSSQEAHVFIVPTRTRRETLRCLSSTGPCVQAV